MSWTKEDRLLLHCCRREKEEKTKHIKNKAEKNDIDWDYFLRKARENGISAIIYSKLNENKADFLNIPSYIFEKLKKDYYLNATKNALIFMELGKVLEALKKAGLQVIVLKGAPLAEVVYKNLALRPMLDVDLLVKKKDLLRIDKQLKILDYWPLDRSIDDGDFSPTYLTTRDYRSSSVNSPSFHIHWHFVNSSIPNESYIKHIRMEDIWQDAEKTHIANVETLAMSPHHLIIHLSEHALRVTHSLSKLSFFCDIHEVINFYKERLDWNQLIEESQKFNLNRLVYLSLYFSFNFFGTYVPEDVLLRLRPERFSLGEKIFMNSVSNNRRFSGLSYLVHLSLNKGLFRKMEFVWRTFFPPRQIIAQRSYIPQSNLSSVSYFRRINEVFSHLLKALK